MDSPQIVIHTWASRGGRHWFKLYKQGDSYGYHGEGSGGNIGLVSEEDAMKFMQRKLCYAKLDGINMKLIS